MDYDKLEMEQEQAEDELLGQEAEDTAKHLRAAWAKKLLELVRFMQENPESSLERAAYALDMDVGEILRTAEDMGFDDPSSDLLIRGEQSYARGVGAPGGGRRKFQTQEEFESDATRDEGYDDDDDDDYDEGGNVDLDYLMGYSSEQDPYEQEEDDDDLAEAPNIVASIITEDPDIFK